MEAYLEAYHKIVDNADELRHHEATEAGTEAPEVTGSSANVVER